MKEAQILKAYEFAKERYAAIGVDTDKAVETLEKTPISLHCWQTDDVIGFESAAGLSGGIQTTGNYPGRARNIDEVRADVKFAKSLIAGNHRLNLHEIYGDFGGKFVDRDEVTVDYFQSWIQWAKENNMKLDFNSTSFGHPKSGNLSLANPDPAIREFWIEHTKRCRRIADAMGKAQGDPCIMNIWVHDGSKDQTVERKRYREIFAEALDEILKEDLPGMKTCLEAKLFGIGLESYTVGSHDFVAGYCATRKLMYTLDTGHYEMTENVADMVAHVSVKTPTALADEFIDCYMAEDERISAFGVRLRLAFLNKVNALSSRVDLLEARILAADPRTILKRGYILAADARGRVLKSADAASPGDSISLMFADGTLDCDVKGRR